MPHGPPYLSRTGRALATAIAALISIANVASAAAAPAQATATESRNEEVSTRQIRVAVMMLNFGTGTNFDVTRDEIAATYFGSTRSVADLYRVASNGAVGVTGNVF